MFNSEPKPEFHTYPLRTNELSKLTQEMAELDLEIYQNRKEIQQINKKFNQQQIQSSFIQRLHQKNRILQLKKQELQHINSIHQYHQNAENHEKKVSKSIHTNLVNEYKQQIEEKIRKKSQQKQSQKLRDKKLMEENIRIVDQIEKEKQRKREQMYKLGLRENKEIQEYLTNVKQQNREKDKKQYIQFLSQSQRGPTQKQLAFQQFYKKNQENSNNLYKIYKTSTQPLNEERLSQKHQIQSKNHLQYIQKLQKKAIQQQERKTQNRDSLKKYLENQISANQIKRNNQSKTKLLQDINRSSGQINNERYQASSRQKTKFSQHLYSTQLAKQYNDLVQAQKVNSLRSRQHHYMNQSSDVLASRKEINSPESPKSGIFLGNQKNRNAAHNPIINPIPFSIGITNPYVLKQYENRRISPVNGFNDYSSSFKGSKLAQLGDQSFRN